MRQPLGFQGLDVETARTREAGDEAIMRYTVLPTTAIAMVLMLASHSVAVAQQPGAQPRPAPTKQATPAPPKAAPVEQPPQASSGGDAGALRQRVEQLEEQLVDMQVTVGTLESLARGGGAASNRAPTGLPSGGGDAARVDALENQVRVLSNMVEQMQQQVRQARPGPQAALPPPAATQPAPVVGGFQTQVTPGNGNDPIGSIIGQPPSAVPPASANPSLPQAGAADGSAKDLYATAYGLLLAQDYAAAEAAFEEFLKRFPNDALAGNAQYWLGETFYVRGNFKAAAAAFLKGYQSYARSQKASDSLLKLAMSLDRLGQRDAACQSFSELNTRYPNAPGAVRSRADSERRRLGCA